MHVFRVQGDTFGSPLRKIVATEAATADRLTRKPNQCVTNSVVIVIFHHFFFFSFLFDGLFPVLTLLPAAGRRPLTNVEPKDQTESPGAEYSHVTSPGMMLMRVVRLLCRCSVILQHAEHAAHDASN